MIITLNGESREISATNLADLLEECDFSGQIATALNGEFVPHTSREETKLTQGDRVEILAPMQGG